MQTEHTNNTLMCMKQSNPCLKMMWDFDYIMQAFSLAFPMCKWLLEVKSLAQWTRILTVCGCISKSIELETIYEPFDHHAANYVLVPVFAYCRRKVIQGSSLFSPNLVLVSKYLLWVTSEQAGRFVVLIVLLLFLFLCLKIKIGKDF